MEKTICPVCKKKIPVNNEVCPKCFSPLKIGNLAPEYGKKKEKEIISRPEVLKKGDYIGVYRIINIFSGGMGRVYICTDDENRFFALKTFKEELFSSEEIKDSFEKEAQAWIDLGFHPNIVACFGLLKNASQLFLILEYVTPHKLYGNTLTDYLRLHLKPEASLNFAIQFCHGMEHAISRGLVCHRDIKPDNIMITNDAIVKITDFGLSKIIDNADNLTIKEELKGELKSGLSILHSTKGDLIAGTPPWMAPEQFEGKADIRSDIYSFGVVLYQLVNRGRLPFFAQSIEDFYLAHKTLEIPQSYFILNDIIEKCLQKDLNKRYQNFKDLRKDLESTYNRAIGEWTYTPRAREDNDFIINKYVNKAQIYRATEMYDEAIIELKKALEFEGHPIVKAGVYIELGFAYKHKNMFEETLNCFNKANQINPDSESVPYQMGNLYREMGDLDKAIQEYKRALTINPNIFEVHVNLALIYKGKGLIQDAVHEFLEALKIKPKYTRLYYHLGICYQLLKQYDKADEAYQKFVDNPPSDMTNEVEQIRKLRGY